MTTLKKHHNKMKKKSIFVILSILTIISMVVVRQFGAENIVGGNPTR